MSLINDALKKAEKMRSGGASEGGAQPTGPLAALGKRPSKRRAPNASEKNIFLLVAAGVVVLGLAGLGLIFAFNAPVPEPYKKPPAPAVAPTPKPPAPPAPATTPAPAPPSTPANTATPAAPAPEQTTPAAPATQTDTATTPSGVPTTSDHAEPADSPSSPDSVRIVIDEKAPVVQPQDTRVLEFLGQLRISGVRPSPTNARVLMNDHVYRVGDVVQADYALRVTGIEDNRLTFVDGRGAVYTKNF